MTKDSKETTEQLEARKEAHEFLVELARQNSKRAKSPVLRIAFSELELNLTAGLKAVNEQLADVEEAQMAAA